MPAAREQIFAAQPAEAAAEAKPSMLAMSAGIAAIVAACLVLLAVFLLRARGVLQRLALLVATITGGAAFFFAATENDLIRMPNRAAEKTGTRSYPELASLLPLRRALASGTSDVGPLFSAARGDVARLMGSGLRLAVFSTNRRDTTVDATSKRRVPGEFSITLSNQRRNMAGTSKTQSCRDLAIR